MTKELKDYWESQLVDALIKPVGMDCIPLKIPVKNSDLALYATTGVIAAYTETKLKWAYDGKKFYRINTVNPIEDMAINSELQEYLKRGKLPK